FPHVQSCFALFFFYRCGPPRDLHSFPTRRSSDLGARENSLTLAIGSTVGRGCRGRSSSSLRGSGANPSALRTSRTPVGLSGEWRDRKSTRLNSSHLGISYAVFCLKKKKKKDKVRW